MSGGDSGAGSRGEEWVLSWEAARSLWGGASLLRGEFGCGPVAKTEEMDTGGNAVGSSGRKRCRAREQNEAFTAAQSK